MTPKDRNVQFRLTEEDLKILQEKTKEAGFQTVSEYIRHLIREPGISIVNEKLNEILRKLEEKKRPPLCLVN